MKIIYENYETNPLECDILVRVYANQSADFIPEKDAFVGEVLFKPYVGQEHVRFAAEFPRGLAAGIEDTLSHVMGEWTIQISNELPAQVGDLTSCDEHFDTRIKEEMNTLFPEAS